jgi:hypothetical protein
MSPSVSPFVSNLKVLIGNIDIVIPGIGRPTHGTVCVRSTVWMLQQSIKYQKVGPVASYHKVQFSRYRNLVPPCGGSSSTGSGCEPTGFNFSQPRCDGVRRFSSDILRSSRRQN